MTAIHFNAPGKAKVVLSPEGASICGVETPDRTGVFGNIALRREEAGPGSYAGRTLGPTAGRIKEGRLPLGGETCFLSLNNGPHHIHGGFHSLSHRLWDTSPVTETRLGQSVTFSCHAPHGEDGYPGERDFQAVYTLYNEGALEIVYTARTDRPTYVDLSNHAYWNLSGDCRLSGLEQELTINGDAFCQNDEAHLPVALQPVEGTAMDFRKPRLLWTALRDGSEPQLRIGKGLNNAYRLHSGLAAALAEPTSGRRLRLYTDQPALVAYTGGYLPSPSLGIALEAQNFPDAAHCPWAAYRPLLPGEEYRRFIRFVFDCI